MTITSILVWDEKVKKKYIKKVNNWKVLFIFYLMAKINNNFLFNLTIDLILHSVMGLDLNL